MFGYITWDVSPEIFSLGFWALRWYSLFFALGFILSHYIMLDIFKRDGRTTEELDKLTFYMISATILGARIGHCFFYEPQYYLAHPIEILQVWNGGLASHGATVGILLALYIFSKKTQGITYLWILDRIVIVVALCGSLIRLGNLMNSEIVGRPTDLPWGFIFVQDSEHYPLVARHPAQLYESISTFMLFLVLWYLYLKTDLKHKTGLLFGIFCTYLFSLRIGYEFLKENQVAFENGLPLNMGQILSIPMVALGIYCISNALKKTANE
jgi:phosphatidylglycerol:prolipoprotein diacylglycerol transferase